MTAATPRSENPRHRAAVRGLFLSVGLLSVGLAFLGFVAPVATAEPAPAARAKAERRALQVLKKAAQPARLKICEELKKSDDPEGACGTALAAVDILQKRLDKALTARDAQGAKMFKYFKKHVATYRPKRARYTEFRAMEIDNGHLCAEATRLWKDLGQFQEAARAAGLRTGTNDAAGPRLAEKVRKLVGKARSPEAKSALVASLRGPLVRALAGDLHDWALSFRGRSLSVAAQRTLATVPEVADVARLRPCAECEDPGVRRASFELLAAMGDAAAVDVLVERLQVEQGIPALEIVRYLRELSEQTFGVDPRPWVNWWKASRPGWERRALSGSAVGDLEAETYSRYFGLELHSARVLFVLDHSGSMSEWIGFHEGLREGDATKSPDKMSVAIRETLAAIDGFDDRVSFNVLSYGTDLDRWEPRPITAIDENRGKAKRWVERLSPHGMTNLSGSLLDALEKTRPSNPLRDRAVADTIVVLSDGEPNGGPIASDDDVLDEVARLNSDGLVTIHTVFLGVDGKEEFMRRLAEQNGGKFVHHKH